ncbi:MAG: T9SS type A sorting domain-containing protein [Flavobacteriales bacterium]
MRTLLPRLILMVGVTGFFYSCNHNQEKQKKEETVKVEETPKNQKRNKIKGYLDYVRNITTPYGEKKSGYTPKHYINEYTKAKNRRIELTKAGLIKRAASSNIVWKERGPANIPGRMRSIAIHPTNKNLWYIGSVGGGVWKTEDGGATFTNLTDGKVPSIATSYVVFSDANTNTIYAGTGESYFNTDAISGIGIIKSTDEGQTWTYLTNTLMMGSISRIAIDPSNENIVVVASGTGLYKTTDGGVTWITKKSSNFNDLKAAPGNFNMMYVYDTTNKIIIKSTDAGETWTTVYSADTLPDFNRIELVVSPSNPNKVYGSVYTSKDDELIMTEDGGNNWSKVMEANGITSYNKFLGGQGWYNNTLQVHPFNDNIIYCGGVNLFKMVISDNAGTKERTTTPMTDAYKDVTGAYKNENVHVDHHVIEIIRGTGNQFKIVTGNDGGIAISNMAEDPGVNEGDWPVGTVTGMNTTQYYGADKKNGTSQYVGGAQDNGSHISPVNPDNTASFTHVWSGDGFETAWNYDDPNKIIVSAQYNQLGVSINGGQKFLLANLNNGFSPFISKIANSKNNPDFAYAIDDFGVWKTENFGYNWSRTDVDFFNGKGGDVAVSLANPEIVWTAGVFGKSTSYKMFVSKDLGNTYEAVKQPSIDFNAYISALETHPTEENTAYVLFSLKGRAKVLKTEDLGQTWTDITGFPATGTGSSTNGFPDVAVHSLVVMPYDTNVIWVGTDLGIFQTTDGGGSWVYLDEGLPTVSIWDMKVVNDEVVISTHGRGIWTATIPELTGYEPLIYTRAPEINNAHQKWNENNIINFSMDLFSDYDDTKIFVNGSVIESLGTTTKGTTLNREITVSEGLTEVIIKLVSNKGSTEKTSNEVTIPLVDFNTATEEYLNDFEGATKPLPSYFYEDATIASRLFDYYSEKEWSVGTFILNIDIPYKNSSQYIAMVEKPIKVIGDETSKIKFKNIAIVEPGDNTGLWDYVVVEATKDGKNWIELSDRYDANSESSWLNAYNSGIVPGENGFRQEIINLNDFFVKDDIILVRFRLYTDGSVGSFGWFIDDIEIQKSIAELVPNDNYVIRVEDETCENQDNGSINVTAKKPLNYTYTLNDNSVSKQGTFTSILSFDNLSAGTYTLCFGLENNTSYKQCFDLVVGEPSNLLATTKVNKSDRTVTVNIERGTAPYSVVLNGRTYSVNTKSIELPLIQGSNHIVVSSDIVCEGMMIDTINTETESLEVKAYPNPVINQLFITIPSAYKLNQIPIQIYSANGLLVTTNIYTIHNGKIEINTNSLKSGLYFVKIGNLDTVKIIKK